MLGALHQCLKVANVIGYGDAGKIDYSDPWSPALDTLAAGLGLGQVTADNRCPVLPWLPCGWWQLP